MKLILLGVVVLLLIIGVLLYNRLISLRNRVDNAWSQIDIQLQRRYDLIPNLVETVKGYATHESGVFERVTQARANAMNAQGVVQQAEAENQITGALKSLFAVSEAYPDLEANTNFLNLQEQLDETENRIAYSRQYYNESVNNYNNAVQTVPSNIVAGMFKFKTRELFETDSPEARGPVKVQF